jgi:hypothetical protein
MVVDPRTATSGYTQFPHPQRVQQNWACLKRGERYRPALCAESL